MKKDAWMGRVGLSLLVSYGTLAGCESSEDTRRPAPDAALTDGSLTDASLTDASLADVTDAGGTEETIATDKGPVTGTVANGIRSFLGIPYAAAPVDALRWKAPTEVRWTSPRAAKAFGPRCFGVSLLDPNTLRSGASEDCLSLNIASPVGASAKPVLVWLHGGGFIDGRGDDYPGAALASAGDIVVVTLNYRLGVLGTLGIPSADGGGNLGLLDQRFALEWIHRNIAAFGGDPAKITLAGQSAGAQAACTHAAMPGSRGLLSAILMESGSCDWVQTADQAAASANTVAKKLGCAGTGDAGTIDEACLRALPAETLLRGDRTVVYPIVDGKLLPVAPRAALAAGTFAKVPILAGFNANEGYFMVDGLYGALPLTSATDYENALNLLFGQLGPILRDQYPLASYGNDPRVALAAVLGDGLFECSTRHLVASSTSPAFTYVFRHAPSLATPKPVSAMHSVELPFIWGTPLPWTWWAQENAGVPSTSRELELAGQMKGYWRNFVRTGNPSPEPTREPLWSAWSPSTNDAMNFAGDATAIAPLAANPHCQLWDVVYGPH
ncbi:carboxylesterase family protein [Pendulispora rubella]|uniref:Carboxylic ester hydrolase n=1 Tax=Pendulispora rubella TaxID=2741070 RepID=A0ABZ2LF84_9BACT